MNTLIPINYDNPERPTVSGRELHEFLGVKSKYADWFKNMSAYGFDENVDYTSFSKNLENGGRSIDHQLTIPMAKELCMLQRNERGKQARKYFIAVEEQWNSPDAVMRRAVLIAQDQNEKLKASNQALLKENNDLRPDAEYARTVCLGDNCRTVGSIAKDYGMTAERLNTILHGLKIQYKTPDKQWVLYSKYCNKGYTKNRKSKPITHNSGRITTPNTTVWTESGQRFIYDQLAKIGYLPVVDSEKV